MKQILYKSWIQEGGSINIQNQLELFMKLFIILLLSLIMMRKCCKNNEERKKSIIRGNYRNVLQLNGGAIISSRKMNYFFEGCLTSLCLRDSIYNTDWNKGYYACNQYKSIIIDLFQPYQLNTIKLRIWDLQLTRYYNMEVYLIYEGIKTLIYKSITQSVVTIKFIDQFVQQIELYNRNGNTVHSKLEIIKIEAFYQL
ncbi:unnamed protein product [Paramecium octaurelia]|uniref:Uncharacterized protein n=1 Tax=Paramecium octaurelia TaxID=43137 RepID=A0A8S1UZ66_PAROT|nr:unnamed protein product [Paramecium octaurelia]CAD8167787.1 unnamed protein product [Paramecium octaurelia]